MNLIVDNSRVHAVVAEKIHGSLGRLHMCCDVWDRFLILISNHLAQRHGAFEVIEKVAQLDKADELHLVRATVLLMLNFSFLDLLGIQTNSLAEHHLVARPCLRLNPSR